MPPADADQFLALVLAQQAAANAVTSGGSPVAMEAQLASLAADLAVRCAAFRQAVSLGMAADLAQAVQEQLRLARLQQAVTALHLMLAAQAPAPPAQGLGDDRAGPAGAAAAAPTPQRATPTLAAT